MEEPTPPSRILPVDDDPVLRAHLTETLTTSG